jgi:hypothetical protein
MILSILAQKFWTSFIALDLLSPFILTPIRLNKNLKYASRKPLHIRQSYSRKGLERLLGSDDTHQNVSFMSRIIIARNPRFFGKLFLIQCVLF